MITKLQNIGHLQNALNYCERGGELLYTNKCLGNSNDIHQQMKINNALNDRCLTKSFHIKIRIAPEDKGILSTQDWMDISKDYANKIGYQNNPYAVYIHKEDTDTEHIHIVASKIKENNTSVDTSYTHYKNMDFCRKMETKYGLRKVNRKLEKLKKQEIFISDDKRLPLLKEKIVASIQNSTNMDEFKRNLKQQKVTVKIGRGISFSDEKGAKFKGSQIDRKFSLKNINQLFQNKEANKTQSFGMNL